MSEQLANEKIIETLRRSFAPFRCVAQLQDYENRIGFRVYASNGEILGTFEGNTTDSVRDPKVLRQLVDDTRAFLERRHKVKFDKLR